MISYRRMGERERVVEKERERERERVNQPTNRI